MGILASLKRVISVVAQMTLTVESFSISASEAPREARPISWLNCAKLGSASRGM